MKTSLWLSTDPKMEKYPNYSAYVYCKQSPISRFDPDGMDDIFTSIGKFVRHDENGTNNIMIQQGKRLSRIDNFDGSNSWFSSQDNYNRDMMNNVLRYYLGGITKTSLKDEVSNDDIGALAFYNQSGDKGMKVQLKNGYFPSLLADSNNLMNSLLHEYFHKLDDKNGVKNTYLSHSEVYVKQMKSKLFNVTTEDYQRGMISNFTQYLSGIMAEGSESWKPLLEKFNRTNSAKYKMTFQDSGGFRLFNKQGVEKPLPIRPVLTNPN